MNKVNQLIVGLLLLSSILLPARSEAQDKKPLYFGSVAMDIPAVMHIRLTPLTEYLSEELGRPVILKLSPNMPAAIKAVANKEVDFAYLTPVAYVKANKMGQSQVVVKTVTNNKPYFQLMIVVRNDSDIKTVGDLVGKHFAFGDRAALLQRVVVTGAGMPLEKLGQYSFIGHYDNIVRGVLNRDYDAGILKDTLAYKWQGKGVRILHTSPELPPYNIAASAKVSKELYKKLQQAFTKLDINNPEHKKVINALGFKYSGFIAANDADYNIVRKLIKPFEKK